MVTGQAEGSSRGSSAEADRVSLARKARAWLNWPWRMERTRLETLGQVWVRSDEEK